MNRENHENLQNPSIEPIIAKETSSNTIESGSIHFDRFVFPRSAMPRISNANPIPNEIENNFSIKKLKIILVSKRLYLCSKPRSIHFRIVHEGCKINVLPSVVSMDGKNFVDMVFVVMLEA